MKDELVMLDSEAGEYRSGEWKPAETTTITACTSDYGAPK